MSSGGGGPMRRKPMRSHKQRKNALRWKLLVVGMLGTLVWFNGYIDREIRPTLMKLAEYEARSITLQTVHEAVNDQMQQSPDLCASLYLVQEDWVQMDAAAANRIRSQMICAVEVAMQSLPEHAYGIPFGSLTGNSLLNGHGPVWEVTLQPEGYAEAQWQEKSESLSINTTRYAAELLVEVTVNMILDGRTETLTVRDTIPMADILLRGDTPSAYAASLD